MQVPEFRAPYLFASAAIVALAHGLCPRAQSTPPDGAGANLPAEPCAGPVPLADFAARYPLAVESREPEQIALTRGAFRISFRPDSRRASVQGVTVWLQRPLRREGPTWFLGRADADQVLDPLLRTYRHVPPRPVRTIVLDPGHGGADGGAVTADGWTEKEAALDLAHRVRARLEAQGFRVFLTREDDRYLSLSDRVRIATERRADVFLSIHFNGWTNPGAEGIETYVLTKAGETSTNHRSSETSEARLARQIGNRYDGANAVLGYVLQRRLLDQTGSVDRGLRHARFRVLRHAPCPAALVECGFLTHPEESARLREAGYRERLAKGIAEGIREYAREADRARWVHW